MHEGTWVAETKSWRELGIDMDEVPRTMSSEIGQIPRDGGDFLKFLKAVRAIVEADGQAIGRRKVLSQELARAEWSEFCKLLGGKEAIYSIFFPGFIDTIPRLTSETVQALWSNEWTTPAKLSAVPDGNLLAIKGIGQSKLKIIRKACEEAVSKDSELVDLVER